MQKRIIVSFAVLPLLFICVYFTPDWVLPFAFGALGGLAAFEMLYNTGLIKKSFLLTISIILSAIYIPLDFFFEIPFIVFIISTVLIVFFIAIISRGRISNYEILGAFFTIVFIPISLGSIVRIKSMPDGISLVLIPMIAAWITDTCAYFTGTFFGRHKLIPEISPKKTVEGAIGGVLGCIILMIAYTFIAELIWGTKFDILPIALIAGVGSLVSIIGDLALSYIKRGFDIKDFGTILPGHGGVLDRFDSLLFTAPVIELLLMYIKVII